MKKIKKEHIELYSALFVRFTELQCEYENLYEINGGNNPEISFEENMKNAFKYGAIINRIQVVRESIPKPNNDMSSEERELNKMINAYAIFLVIIKPHLAEIKNINMVHRTKKNFEILLESVKQFNQS